MRRVIVGTVILGMFGFVVGCSKKKEEAAKLQEEMLAQDSNALETSADSSSMYEDSTEQSKAMDAEAIPEEPTLEAMPPRPTGSGYTIQVAGCESGEYAQSLVERYRKRGYDPYVETAMVEGQQYYRVRIGILSTLSEARTLQAELQDKYSVSAWIDRAE